MTTKLDRFTDYDDGAKELEDFLEWVHGPDRVTKGNGLLPSDAFDEDGDEIDD